MGVPQVGFVGIKKGWLFVPSTSQAFSLHVVMHGADPERLDLTASEARKLLHESLRTQ